MPVSSLSTNSTSATLVKPAQARFAVEAVLFPETQPQQSPLVQPPPTTESRQATGAPPSDSPPILEPMPMHIFCKNLQP